MEKNWKKRWMAGAMAFALCCTTLLQTGASAVSAAEVGGVSAQSETQIEVQTETQTETETQTKTENESETENRSQTETAAETHTTVETETKADPKPETETGTGAETSYETENNVPSAQETENDAVGSERNTPDSDPAAEAAWEQEARCENRRNPGAGNTVCHRRIQKGNYRRKQQRNCIGKQADGGRDQTDRNNRNRHRGGQYRESSFQGSC